MNIKRYLLTITTCFLAGFTLQAQTVTPGGVTDGTFAVWLTPENYTNGTWKNNISGGPGNFTARNAATPPASSNTRGYNFHSSVVFATSGSTAPNCLRSANAYPVANKNVTTFFVLKRSDNTSSNNLIGFNNDAGSGNMVWSTTSGNLRLRWASNLTTILTAGMGIITIDNGNRNSSSSVLSYVNGEAKTMGNGGAAAYNSPIELGASGIGHYGFDGDIQEVIVYSAGGAGSHVMEKNLQKIHSYLAVKYGWTLGLSNILSEIASTYVNSTGDVFWTYDANFNQKIFGIGRDDASGLYQKQGREANDSYFTAFVGNRVTMLNSQNNGELKNKQYIMFGASTPGNIDLTYMHPIHSFSNGTSSDSVNYRMKQVHKAYASKDGVENSVTVKLQVPTTIPYILVSTSTAFTPASTRIYKTKEGVATIDIGAGYVYIDFAGYHKTFSGGPGNVTGDLRLWLRADEPTLVNLATATNGGGTTQLNTVDVLEEPKIRREMSVDKWINLVTDASGNQTEYEYLNRSYSNRPGWHSIVSNMNYHPSVTFHRRDLSININSGSDTSIEYLVSKTKGIFQKNTPSQLTIFIAVNPVLKNSDDATYFFGFGPGKNIGWVGNAMNRPIIGLNVQSNTGNAHSFRYAEYGWAGNTSSNPLYGTVGTSDMFASGQTLIMNNYINFNYSSTADSLVFGVNGKYEMSNSTSGNNYDARRGTESEFAGYSCVGASGWSSRGLKGTIGEMIAFERRLTSDEYERIYSYLALKYGITLEIPTNNINQATPSYNSGNINHNNRFDYKLSDGTVVWAGIDTTHPESNYHRNIAGVVRDDEPKLLNRQAHSTNLGSLLHVGVAGRKLDFDGRSDLGDFANDKEAVVWGHNGNSGIANNNLLCTRFDKVFTRRWLFEKTTKNNRPIDLLVGIQNHGNDEFKDSSLSTYYTQLRKGINLFMLVSTNPACIDPASASYGTGNFEIVPMSYLNGEHQCIYQFSEEETYITFAYSSIGANGCFSDLEFDGTKTFNWAQWKPSPNNGNTEATTKNKTFTTPTFNIGADIEVATEIKYEGNTRAPYRYPVNNNVVRDGIEIRRTHGVPGDASKVITTIVFNQPVIPEFAISGLDSWYRQRDEVSITGYCDAGGIEPKLMYAGTNPTFRIRSNKATVDKDITRGATDKNAMLNVSFEESVKKIEIVYTIQNRIYGSVYQSIFISPITLRQGALPPPLINKDGIGFTQQVKNKKITACDEVKYTFYIENINREDKYFSFSDTLPNGMTWDVESLILDTAYILNTPGIIINNYGNSNILSVDSILLKCASSLKMTAIAILDENASGDYSNRASLKYQHSRTNGGLATVSDTTIRSIDYDTYEAQTIVNVTPSMRYAPVIVILDHPGTYATDQVIPVKLTLINPNSNTSFTDMFMDVVWSGKFTYQPGSLKMYKGMTYNPGSLIGGVEVVPLPENPQQLFAAGDTTGVNGFSLPAPAGSPTSIEFSIVAPSSGDLELAENGQGIAPLTLYWNLYKDDSNACVLYALNNLNGVITLPYKAFLVDSIVPAIGPNTGGAYTGSSSITGGTPMHWGVNTRAAVTIYGGDFSLGTLDVKFGNVSVPAADITEVYADRLVCIPPAVSGGTVWGANYTSGWGGEGKVEVKVTRDNTTNASLTDSYTYRAPITVTGVTPNAGEALGGKEVKIAGHNFLPPALNNLPPPFFDLIFGTPAEIAVGQGVKPDTLKVTNDTVYAITKQHLVNYVAVLVDNSVEKNSLNNAYTYFPTVFTVDGNWSAPDNWEGQTADQILPYPHSVIQIKANCMQDINVDMDSITVDPLKSYTVNSGATLKAREFTLRDNASFLNYGIDNIEKARVTHTLARGRNWYLSSPTQRPGSVPAIGPALGKDTLGNPLSNWRVEWYKEAGHGWESTQITDEFVTGLGYTAYSGNEDIAVCFTGKFTDGNVISPVMTRQNDLHSKRGFNLVGNPFPSYWRWTSAAAQDARTYSTIWYRTNVGVPSTYDGYQFWAYNAVGNVAVAPGWEDEIHAGPYSLAYIPPMQAFWVRLREGQTQETLTFANNRRSHADHSSNILKSAGMEMLHASPLHNETRPLLRLIVTDGVRADETLIYADSQAMAGFDDYDSDKWFIEKGAELFTLPVMDVEARSASFPLAINGLPEISGGMEIPLGFQAVEGGAFSFCAKEILNMDKWDVILNDKRRQVEFDLRSGAGYMFTSGSTCTTERFSIVFRRSSGTASIDLAGNDNLLAYTGKNGQIVVLLNTRNLQDGAANIAVFDVAGRKLTEQSVVAGTPTTLNITFPVGVYLLRAGKLTAKVVVSK